VRVVDERSKTGNALAPVPSLERPGTRPPAGETAAGPGSDETCTSRLAPDVAYGEAPLPRDLVAGLLTRINSLSASISARPSITTLSSREREVLALVAEGHGNKTIARGLYSSEFTAKRHVQNVLKRLALHRRPDAATRFREEVNAGPPGALSFESEQS